jgi:hypothetical protein
MGNAHSPHIDKCSLCHKGMRDLMKPVEKMECEGASTLVEMGCQAFAVFNMEDGIGEVLEPVCDIVPAAFTEGCKEAASNDKIPWNHYVLKNACKHLC